MNILSHDLSSHLLNSLFLLASDSKFLATTFFTYFVHFLFLEFSPSNPLQVCRLLLAFNEYEDMFNFVCYKLWVIIDCERVLYNNDVR